MLDGGGTLPRKDGYNEQFKGRDGAVNYSLQLRCRHSCSHLVQKNNF